MPTIKQIRANGTNFMIGRSGCDVRYIVVHYTATNASAYNNGLYFKNHEYLYSSAHYFIDGSGTIIQSVPDNCTAYSVGNWPMNLRSISIEVVSAGQDFDADEISELRWLVMRLMKEYDVPASRVIRHYDVADMPECVGDVTDPHKRCPAPYVNGTKWRSLKATITTDAKQEPGKPINNVGMHYRTHVQNLGWLAPVHDGQTSGTVGASLRVEAIKMTPPEGVTLTVNVHIQNKGWVTYEGVKRGGNDPVMGTEGESKRLEAVQIHCTENSTGKNIRYRAHVQGKGWLGWCNDGDIAGTTGQSLRLEAIQIEFV